MSEADSVWPTSRRVFGLLGRCAFGFLCVAVVAANVLILRTERLAESQIAVISAVVPEQSRQSPPVSVKESDVSALWSKAVDAERALIGLESARPLASLAGLEERVRQSTERAAALAAALANSKQGPLTATADVASEPRLFYADYSLVDEVFELRGPPNTARNPATYSFAARYGNNLFPEVSFPEISRGQIAGAYKLLNVNVETRLGEVVKDKVVRHRRRKGGIREPVWSYKRLPNRQVVVFQIADLRDGAEHVLHYPGEGQGEIRHLRTQTPVAWLEVRESETETKKQFPVMAGSNFTWGGSNYVVIEVSPQELKLETHEPPAKHVWLIGAGP